jgi:hypothetical protein
MQNWYKKCRAKIEQLYGNDADLFCNLLAACSPRRHVKTNWKMAVNIYKHRDYTGCMPCHFANIKRALAGKELSGRKVRAFAANLKGDLNKVTVDVWVARFFGFDKVTDKIYSMVESIIRAAAAYEGLKPAEMQAQIWCEAMQAEGRTPISFLAAIDNQMEFNFGG